MKLKILLILIVSTLFMSGCKEEEEINPNLLYIDLIVNHDPVFFEKSVILYDDNNFLIKTNFDSYINDYPFEILNVYDELKEQAIQDIEMSDVINMTDYLYLPQDSTYILAHHLENGSCLIYDKVNRKIIQKIGMEEWEYIPAPFAGLSGRKFYINNDLFLKTTDWIS